MAFIYFDEHGNTGEFLLDPEQPVFALASNDYSDDEAHDLLGLLRSQGAEEVKFKTLRRSSGGIARLERFLNDPQVKSNRIAAYTVDKRVMVLSKMLDIVLETLMHESGLDFNENGLNLATLNIMHLMLPILAGQEAYDTLLQSFMWLIRTRKISDLDVYLKTGSEILKTIDDIEFRCFIAPMFERELTSLWLDSLPLENNLNPAEACLFFLINFWGERKTNRFTVVHDESKPIFKSRKLFLQMMAKSNEESRMVGYDRRKFLFPLRAKDIQLKSSQKVPQIQIADVCAGAAAYAMRSKLFDLKDALAELVEAANVLDWVVGSIHASCNVTPEDLGADIQDAEKPTDVITGRICR